MPYGEVVRSEVGEKEALCPFGSSPLMTDGSMDHLPDSSSPSGILALFQGSKMPSFPRSVYSVWSGEHVN